jgi:hypothetical protein
LTTQLAKILVKGDFGTGAGTVKNETFDSIDLVGAVYFFWHFPPKNRMSSPQTTQTVANQQHPLGV